jgi:AmmeMemoRadiSam system protein A
MPKNLPKEMLQAKAGVFVSLKKHGELRGCIGTISHTTDNIAQEIMRNAISAGTGDPRFFPVQEDELDELQYSVDVLMKPEAIDSVDQLDVKRYGVIVRSGYKSGLLLPNLEGVDTVEEQLEIVLQKAGIGRNENYKMERFEVIRHK